ncbi:MAG: response regulator transcription factor [Nitriliruptoraceae bacterium]
MTPPATVVLADDDPIVRRSVAALLDPDDFTIVGEAAEIRTLIARVRSHSPQLVLTSTVLGGTPVWPTIEQLVARTVAPRVVAMTTLPDATEAAAVIRAGAAGYARTDGPADSLTAVCRRVLRGELAATAEVADTLVSAIALTYASDDPPDTGPLTTRELDVLRHVALGLRTREIAIALGLADNTVKNHMRSVRAKLQAHTSVGAVMTALQRGYLPRT